jgi:hypothetical protein
MPKRLQSAPLLGFGTKKPPVQSGHPSQALPVELELVSETQSLY